MTPCTIAILSEVAGRPSLKLTLPLVRLGEKVRLGCTLRRQHNGRTEVLDLRGEYQVTSVVIDAGHGAPHPVIELASLGIAPAWKAVRKRVSKLGPTCYPRTPVD